MAPKSAAALVLLAAMIAGLAPPLQAQTGDSFMDGFLSVVNDVCSGDALLKAVTSGESKRCACGFRKLAAERLGFDVDRFCQAASNGRVAIGPSKLKEFCTGAPGN
ncbi:hypothetical protein SETIT_8G222000v2 [Setaria italica]|uniref:Hydrophobic seed protein domain-containing protein n=1 Tax=Setaria italica TaxID=4555 RepID=A0A368SAE0_SETIT|nr:hypothetical protein SETIT_8G222000v2 [Setaria italica]